MGLVVYFSCNPNITMEMIKENPDKPWNWDWISSNKFAKVNNDFIERKCREYMAVYKIKETWKECYYSPYSEIGKGDLDGVTMLYFVNF